MIGRCAEGNDQAGEGPGDEIVERRVNIVFSPFDEFARGLAGKESGEDFIFPQVFGGQGVEVEGEGEKEGENCEL
jgi:hypothetical protein